MKKIMKSRCWWFMGEIHKCSKESSLKFTTR